METTLKWNEKMKLTGIFGDHQVVMDAKSPFGNDSAPTPKQLALGSICGCSAMDVIPLMRKFKQEVTAFEIHADAPTVETHPQIFKEVMLTFKLDGKIEPEKANEAVRLSMTKFCSVSAMFSKAVPIKYKVVVNGVEVGTGKAEFP